MKRLLLALSLVLMPALLMADNYLNVEAVDTTCSVTLSTVQKITFEDGKVQIHTMDGVLLFPMSEMNRISFTDEPTAVDDIAMQSPSLAFDGNSLLVKGTGTLFVYNVNGTLLSLAKVNGRTVIPMHSMLQGTYVVRFGDEVIKIARQ